MTGVTQMESDRTELIHADSKICRGHSVSSDHVAPYITVTSTFDISNSQNVHCYSRMTSDTRDRLESVQRAVDNAQVSLSFSTGLSAVSVLILTLKPARIFVSEGYYGSHKVIELYQSICSSAQVHLIPVNVKDLSMYQPFSSLDLVWLETPSNPHGRVWDVATAVSLFHPAIVAVDSSLSPLAKALDLGAHVVMHSATKYMGGHSDLLAGILSTNDTALGESLKKTRSYIGCVLGNLECWLLLRSLRTLHVRFGEQLKTCLKLVKFLNESVNERSPINQVWHASLDTHPDYQIASTVNGAQTAVFSLVFKEQRFAQQTPFKLHLFTNATSFGGVESLVEWRFNVDKQADPCLVRFSVGLESFEDLRNDLIKITNVETFE